MHKFPLKQPGVCGPPGLTSQTNEPKAKASPRLYLDIHQRFIPSAYMLPFMKYEYCLTWPAFLAGDKVCVTSPLLRGAWGRKREWIPTSEKDFSRQKGSVGRVGAGGREPGRSERNTSWSSQATQSRKYQSLLPTPLTPGPRYWFLHIPGDGCLSRQNHIHNF